MPASSVRPANPAEITPQTPVRPDPERGYVGRFAPTPSGAMHWGSVFAACISWLDARAAGGRWHLRIDDLDRPRVRPGAESAILRELERLGFAWDGTVQHQQGRETQYETLLESLQDRDMVFDCGCTRAMLKHTPARCADGPVYPGTCRPRAAAELHVANDVPTCDARFTTPGPSRAATPTPTRQPGAPRRALRLWLPDALRVSLNDLQLGSLVADATLLGGDFIVRRADGPVAFLLAGIDDDEALGVTHIVRGYDLLSSTLRQQVLREALGLPIPASLHHPLWLDAARRKLSKSQSAPPTSAIAAPRVLAALLARLPAARNNPELDTLLVRAARTTDDDPALQHELLDRTIDALRHRQMALLWPRDDTQLPAEDRSGTVSPTKPAPTSQGKSEKTTLPNNTTRGAGAAR